MDWCSTSGGLHPHLFPAHFEHDRAGLRFALYRVHKGMHLGIPPGAPPTVISNPPRQVGP